MLGGNSSFRFQVNQTSMKKISERDELLAFVAEQYYQEEKKQTEIAEMIDLTRSAVSRMLSEAREKGIVEIIIHHPFQYDQTLGDKLQSVFNLEHVAVVVFHDQPNYDDLRNRLGKAASRLLATLVKPGHHIGLSWGTTVQATIEAYEPQPVKNATVVQLVGVLGSTRHSYSAQILVEHLAEKINGEGQYLYAPFLVENEETADILLKDPVVQQTVSAGRRCDVALMGVGTTKPAYCSLLQGGHIYSQELEAIRDAGAVGDVTGLYYDVEGELVQIPFHHHRIGMALEDILQITTRLGVAGSVEKAEAVLGAVCGGYINSLVTDNLTAIRVLELAQTYC